MLSLKKIKHYLPLIPKLPGLYLESKVIRKNLPEMKNAPDLEGEILIGNDEFLNVIFIGESTISGVGVATNSEGFSGALSKILSEKLNKNVSWKVFAKSGFNVKKIATEIIPNIPDQTADFIFIGIGGNDAFELTHPESFRENLEELIKNLKQKFPETPLIFINFPAVEDFPALTPKLKKLMISWVKNLQKQMIDVASKERLVYFDPEIITFSSWRDKLNLDLELEELFSDGIHPSKISYQLWAEIVAEFVLNKEKII
ncbi:SGNH/GDSL hydrolase family protein [Halpernia frigidisoli]|uniref:Lysophospholipase L1 n=1 Tax=Halpernia frigidisoli TaxID=1125876 RepID=A0A1I3J0A2_9FLAO|nr:SGNH/GDSL hydrolase family protein [Halpernia frigidisoli]SFI53505.1 Lysophospholipase L1 [Halpernia frigidisoli]